MRWLEKKIDFREILLTENQRFFCTLFGATFTLILNLLFDLAFFCIFVKYLYLNLAKISIETNTFTKNYILNFIKSLKT